ncbi:hypothetical protein GA707_20615, partial [Nostocoides sp. F2B08]|uniref:tetratricopeptide repeat protein n=1 Tax=Nostocoides sp. F2B08 TaxID=2653936 RepID=UPI001326DF93
APMRALVEVVVDWQRTGIPDVITEAQALELWAAYLPRRDAARISAGDHVEAQALIAAARRDASTPVPGTAASLITRNGTLLRAEDLLVHERATRGGDIQPAVWNAAMEQALASLDTAPASVNVVSYYAWLSGNQEVARRGWQATAQAGDPTGQSNLGLLVARLDPPELDEARHWLTLAAEANHAGAQNNLGILLLTQWDPPELTEARARYAAAARAGNANAQTNLGTLLATRWDPPELEEARRWYTVAAEAGHTGAQFSLGFLLATVWDPPELGEARRWYTAAAEAGDTDAQ